MLVECQKIDFFLDLHSRFIPKFLFDYAVTLSLFSTRQKKKIYEKKTHNQKVSFLLRKIVLIRYIKYDHPEKGGLIKDQKAKIDDHDDNGESHSNSDSDDDVDTFCKELFQNLLNLETNTSVEINAEVTARVGAAGATAEMKAVVSALALLMMAVIESLHSLTTHDMSVMKVVLVVVMKYHPRRVAVTSCHHAFSPTSQSVHHRYLTRKIGRTLRQCPSPLLRPADSG